MSTVPPSPWTAGGCTGPGGLTAAQETGNEMDVNLTAPRNTLVLWPSVLTGIRCGFLFTCLLVRRYLRELLLFLQGIMHETRSIFTVQFYPDANPGPRDTEVKYEG